MYTACCRVHRDPRVREECLGGLERRVREERWDPQDQRDYRDPKVRPVKTVTLVLLALLDPLDPWDQGASLGLRTTPKR